MQSEDEVVLSAEAVLSCAQSPCECGRPPPQMSQDEEIEEEDHFDTQAPHTWSVWETQVEETNVPRTWSMWQMQAAPVSCTCEPCVQERAGTEALLRFAPSPSLRGVASTPLARCVSASGIGTPRETPTRYLSASALPLPPKPPELRLDLPRGSARRMPASAPTRLPRSPVFIQRSEDRASGRRLIEVLDALNALRDNDEEPASSSCIFRNFESVDPNITPPTPVKPAPDTSSFALLPRVRAAARRLSMSTPSTAPPCERECSLHEPEARKAPPRRCTMWRSLIGLPTAREDCSISQTPADARKRPSSRIACAAKRFFRRRPRKPPRALSAQW